MARGDRRVNTVVDAFYHRRKRTINNTRTDGTTLWLFGNEIAQWANDRLYVTNADWPTVTTQGRLNCIPGVSYYRVKGEGTLNGKPWDGSWACVVMGGAALCHDWHYGAPDDEPEDEQPVMPYQEVKQDYGSCPVCATAMWGSNAADDNDTLLEGGCRCPHGCYTWEFSYGHTYIRVGRREWVRTKVASHEAIHAQIVEYTAACEAMRALGLVGSIPEPDLA